MYRSGTTQGLKIMVAMLNLLLFFLSPLHKKCLGGDIHSWTHTRLNHMELSALLSPKNLLLGVLLLNRFRWKSLGRFSLTILNHFVIWNQQNGFIGSAPKLLLLLKIILLWETFNWSWEAMCFPAGLKASTFDVQLNKTCFSKFNPFFYFFFCTANNLWAQFHFKLMLTFLFFEILHWLDFLQKSGWIGSVLLLPEGK